ncbi:hypothetical protein SLEP1_g50906 [Rubroshorea leprosula]|uniref:DUF7745 domain-containing protein n=1 Tax=Rubroshorea leprosula TaxID=152421 RepID=A0AAV5M1I0_9ROSI|nr:hypothetical protein SLEP1_g50906 [Rubroshorea leprosula]
MDSLEKKNSKGKRVNLELECPPLSKKNKSHKGGFSVQTKRPCVKDLVAAWNSLSNLDKVRFDKKFGKIADLLQVEPDWEIIRASLRFYVPHLRGFVFPEFELVPTIEEYFQLLFSRPEMSSEVYVPDPVNFQLNKLQFQSILQRILSFPLEFTEGCIMKKNEVWGVNWNMMYSKLKFDLSSLSEEDRLNFVALGIYGMVILPTNMDSISSSVVAMFKQLIKNPNLNVAPVLIAETLRDADYIRAHGKGRFTCSAGLFTIWIHAHLSKIPLLGVRGAISYSSALVMRQFRDRQSKPLLDGITSYGFDYSLDTQVINQIGFAKEVWSQCEVRFSRNKISVTSEFEEWRKVWLQDIVIPYDIPIIKEAIIVDLKKRIEELEGLSCAQRVKHENEIREKNMDIYFLEGNVSVANLPVATSALTLGKEPMLSGPLDPIIGGTSGTKPFVLNAGVATVQSNGQEEIQVVKSITEDEDKAIKVKVQLMEETLKSMQGVQTNKPVDISSLCFFPNIQLPHKFKLPELISTMTLVVLMPT